MLTFYKIWKNTVIIKYTMQKVYTDQWNEPQSKFLEQPKVGIQSAL